MMKRYFVYGAGGHALVVMDCAELCGFEITGFIDDINHEPGRCVAGKGVYSAAILQSGDSVFMGFGDNKMRQQIALKLLAQGIEVETLIHPSAVISRYAKIGKGCYIGAQAVVDPNCIIGDFVILNKCSVVSHNSIIGAASHLCPGAICAGCCQIGERCFVGMGSSIIAHIKIANDIHIGAGAVVVENFETPGTLIYGVPARCHSRKQKQ